MLFSAKEKAKTLSEFVFLALVFNIILNYILIKSLLVISQEYAIIGAGMATVVSRLFLLGALSVKTKSQLKLKAKRSYIIKPIIASTVMVIFLVSFNYFVNMNLFFGIIEIFLGALIYFGVLWLIKGVGKEDFDLIKTLVKR